MIPIVLAVAPVYVPEKVKVESVAERFARFPPSDIPEIVELVNPALLSVPVIVGVKVKAPADGTIVCPTVRPLNERVEVESAIEL